jgi:Mg2+/Co2+ transporter CorB
MGISMVLPERLSVRVKVLLEAVLLVMWPLIVVILSIWFCVFWFCFGFEISARRVRYLN